MGEEGLSVSYLAVPKEKGDSSIYTTYFGVSCAFFALKLLARQNSEEDERRFELCDNKMLQGCAQLLGLLFLWRIHKEGGSNGGNCGLDHKLKVAEMEIENLKRMRHEDAKANEKVVGIFASQEQSWFNERKNLRKHIGTLINELRLREKNMYQAIYEVNEKFNKLMDEEQQKKIELEEKLTETETSISELIETAKIQAEVHSTEIRKHKTAFMELLSNYRQLEAELDRANRQVETAKLELDIILEQKEESVLLAKNLSMELAKMRTDSEQKERIQSAMLRKSKMDSSEKQMLLKELKLLKAKKKHAELDKEKRNSVSNSRLEHHSLRSMFANQSNSKLDESEGKRASFIETSRFQLVDYAVEYEHYKETRDAELFSSLSDQYSPTGKDELVGANIKQLEEWVRLEVEKYATSVDKKHHREIDAFVEQMSFKDEKLEEFQWQLLNTEIESKRLQSILEGLNRDVSQLRHDNTRLEALLLDREEEVSSLKQQFESQLDTQSCENPELKSSLHDPGIAYDAVLSKLKVVKKKLVENDKESEKALTKLSLEEAEPFSSNHAKNTLLSLQSQGRCEGGQECRINHILTREERMRGKDKMEESESSSHFLTKNSNSLLSMDLQALGVSQKIKRIKQQLLMLERVRKKTSEEDSESSDKGHRGMKGFQQLLSSLNKQINRYLSLQEKADDLCKRMHKNDVEASTEGSTMSKTKGKSKILEQFLEETFQVQRYMVATGQKLMEIQPKIVSEFVDVAEDIEKPENFDMRRFADSMRTLFQDVQRGLEVRISRIIGDVGGTLACQGITHIKR